MTKPMRPKKGKPTRGSATMPAKPGALTKETLATLNLTDPNPLRKVQGGEGRQFERVTITVPYEWAHALRIIGAERRALQQPGSFSELVREALADWLEKERSA